MSAPLPASRRSFLAASLAAMAACRPRAPDRVASVSPGPAAASAGASASDLAAAEKLALVSYTEGERKQLLESLDGHLELLQARRRFAPPPELAPACIFDPRRGDGRIGPEKALFRRTRADAGPLPSGELELAYAPVTALSEWIRTRRLSSERLTELYLGRLRGIGSRLRGVVTLTEDLARAQAKRADAELARGRYRGALHGIPWGAKDLFDTAGIPTTFGAEPFRHRVPAGDAAVVNRLDEAGAVLVAKLSLGALAYGDIWHGGRTDNPWNPEEGSSGSSAGSAAAVAAGLCGFALGTETLGSIVSPCMRTGATGLRPTFGRVSRHGAMPLCWSLDKIGPIARTVEDCALVLAAIAGPDPRDPSSVDVPLAFDGRAGVAGLRVGHDPAWFRSESATELDKTALAKLRALGVETVELSLPDLPYDALLLVLLAEAAAAFEDLTLSAQDDALSWQDEEAWPNTFRLARFIPAIDLVQADRLRRRVSEVLDDAFSRVDALISPSYAGPLLVATNFSGHPSLTLRVGFQDLPTRDGPTLSDVRPGSAAEKPAPEPRKHRVPHGITLWGRLFDEGTLCRLGIALERELSVWAEQPPVG